MRGVAAKGRAKGRRAESDDQRPEKRARIQLGDVWVERLWRAASVVAPCSGR